MSAPQPSTSSFSHIDFFNLNSPLPQTAHVPPSFDHNPFPVNHLSILLLTNPLLSPPIQCKSVINLLSFTSLSNNSPYFLISTANSFKNKDSSFMTRTSILCFLLVNFSNFFSNSHSKMICSLFEPLACFVLLDDAKEEENSRMVFVLKRKS